ncbi:MAG: hypothetical protein LBG43_05175 [Treponema sp.]|jgi:sugar (pentulose or hexulose) kinase|nr:hypothetical protein [Treponema sp.]
MKTIAGIDMGTQSVKMALYDWEARRTASNVEKYFASLPAAGKNSIAATGISGHQHEFAPLDVSPSFMASGEPNGFNTMKEIWRVNRRAAVARAVVRLPPPPHIVLKRPLIHKRITISICARRNAPPKTRGETNAAFPFIFSHH